MKDIFPAGYKKTALGWIPEDWEIKKLEKIALLQRGFDLPSTNRLSGNVPIISSGGISGYHNQFKVNAPGIVTGRYGTIGEVFYVEEDFWPLNTSLWVKNFYGNDTKYIYYLLCTIDYKKFSDKTGVQGVNRNDLHCINVPLPPLPEQIKIAQILSTWDKAIAQTRQLIAAKQRLKQGLMQQLLTGRLRFNEFGEPVKQDGDIPDGWKNINLGKIAKLETGGTPSTNKPQYWGGHIPWMNSGDINIRQIYGVEGRISEDGLLNSNTKMIPVNSVLIALAGQGKTRGKVAINRIALCTNQSIASIITNPDKLDYNFLFYNLDCRYLELRALSAGDGGRGGLNLFIIKGIKLLLPSLLEQKKIAQVLTCIDAEIKAIQTKITHLQTQKQGLMQKLLTGQIRVKVAAP